MKLTLNGKGNLPEIIDSYVPEMNQWWITSFVPKLQGVNPKDLTAEYTVQFKRNNPEHMQIYEDFKAACKNNIEKGDSIYNWSSWTFEEDKDKDENKDVYILKHTF